MNEEQAQIPRVHSTPRGCDGIVEQHHWGVDCATNVVQYTEDFILRSSATVLL